MAASGSQPRWLFRVRLTLALIFIGVLPFPAYVVWHGLKEGPSLVGEIWSAVLAIKQGRW